MLYKPRSKSLLAFTTMVGLNPTRRNSHRVMQTKGHKTQYIRASLRVEVLTIGRRSSKDAIYDEPVIELQKRMSQTMHVSERTIQRNNAAAAVESARTHGAVVLLDEGGLLPTDSAHFSRIVFKALEQGGSRLTFVVGDADGLPSDVASMKKLQHVQSISLSTLTFTHKMVSL